MASPNLRTLTIHPGNSKEAFLSWFTTHKTLTLPQVHTLILDSEKCSQYSLDRILEPDNLLRKLPNLEILHIMDEYGFEFEIFLAALDTWTKLKTVNVLVYYFRDGGINNNKTEYLHLRTKTLPCIESLDIAKENWMPFENGWRFLDLLPNLKRLNVKLENLPGTYNPELQKQLEQERQGRLRFPHLTSLHAHVTKDSLSQFYPLLGLPSSFTLPITKTTTTTATASSQLPLHPPPPLQRLCVDIFSFDGKFLGEAISGALIFCGISLQELAQNELSKHLFPLLKKPFCRDLRVLKLTGRDGEDKKGINLLKLLLEPVEAPLALAPVSIISDISVITYTTNPATTAIAMTITHGQEPDGYEGLN